jgi:hypothetical protein
MEDPLIEGGNRSFRRGSVLSDYLHSEREDAAQNLPERQDVTEIQKQKNLVRQSGAIFWRALICL